MNSRPQNCSQARQRNSHIPIQAHFAAAMMSENLEFVLDSATTDHFCKERTVFQEFREFKSQAVTAKGTAKIAGIGNIVLVINSGTVAFNLVLKNVYYVPDMCRNLISVRCLCLQNLNVKFSCNQATISNETDDQILTVSLQDKFYSIHANCKSESAGAHIVKNNVAN